MHPDLKLTLRRACRPAAYAVAAFVLAACGGEPPRADPENESQVAQGLSVYTMHCASCHGVKLEGQPNWRDRLATGRLPAPPHDPSGHTWHHSDDLLFSMIRNGMEPHAPPSYNSDMPAFGERLSDTEIWAVLAYIKSTWPQETREAQAEVTRQDAQARK